MGELSRDVRGRFVTGNKGGPGRPNAQAELQYLASLSEVVSRGDWEKIISRAVKDAKNGDHRARQWLTNYLIGRPKERGEINICSNENVDLSALSKDERMELGRLIDKLEPPF